VRPFAKNVALHRAVSTYYEDIIRQPQASNFGWQVLLAGTRRLKCGMYVENRKASGDYAFFMNPKNSHFSL
jgi:hypothetical protein